MSKAIALLALTALSFVVHCMVMMNGWGVSPSSWGWIIGCFIASMAIVAMTTLVTADK